MGITFKNPAAPHKTRDNLFGSNPNTATTRQKRDPRAGGARGPSGHHGDLQSQSTPTMLAKAGVRGIVNTARLTLPGHRQAKLPCTIKNWSLLAICEMPELLIRQNSYLRQS